MEKLTLLEELVEIRKELYVIDGVLLDIIAKLGTIKSSKRGE